VALEPVCVYYTSPAVYAVMCMYELASFSHCDGNVAAGNSTGRRRASCLPTAVSLYVWRGSGVTVCHAGFADTITGAFVWCGAAESAADITTATSGHSCTTGVYGTER